MNTGIDNRLQLTNTGAGVVRPESPLHHRGTTPARDNEALLCERRRNARGVCYAVVHAHDKTWAVQGREIWACVEIGGKLWLPSEAMGLSKGTATRRQAHVVLELSVKTRPCVRLHEEKDGHYTPHESGQLFPESSQLNATLDEVRLMADSSKLQRCLEATGTTKAHRRLRPGITTSSALTGGISSISPSINHSRTALHIYHRSPCGSWGRDVLPSNPCEGKCPCALLENRRWLRSKRSIRAVSSRLCSSALCSAQILLANSAVTSRLGGLASSRRRRKTAV